MRNVERLAALALLLLTVAVFWPVAHCQFINLDDWMYVVDNPPVLHGLTWSGVSWAFRTATAANWHPVTWLSHMLDCQLFGLNSGAHHLVNLLFHAANVLLLFHILKRMTGELWPSAIVAALFAVHPLHVQSVAWISERKDLLSTFFGLLTILMYASYVRAGRATEEGGRRNAEAGGPKQESAKGGKEPAETSASVPRYRGAALYYGLSLLFFALGLMSKPMLVTWPFVLLLLDFWPLGRFPARDKGLGAMAAFRAQAGALSRLLLEKLPFFALTVGSSFITLLAQRQVNAMPSTDLLSFSMRADNALISYARYLGKTVWPNPLAVFYPYQAEWSEWQTGAAAVLLVWISYAAWQQRRRRPFLLFGWLWFLGTLVPVIGLVQVGGQSMADRYMYIPSIGLFAALVWWLNGLAARPGAARVAMGSVAVAALLGCALVTRAQLRYWHDTEALFHHTLDVTGEDPLVEYQLGQELLREGKVEAGLAYVERALQTAEFIKALNNWAWVLATCPDPKVRDGAEAVQLAQRACELTQYHVASCIDTLAAAYAEAGRYDDAVRTAEQARAAALAAGQKEAGTRIAKSIELYRNRMPYHEKPRS